MAMLPLGFLEAVGVGVDVLAKYASQAGTLREMAEVAAGAKTAQGAYFKFAGMVRAGRPGVPFAEISELYRAAKYFADPKSYWGAYDKDVIMDRRLATVVPSPTGLDPTGEPIRYGVRVTVTFPGTGDQKDFLLWVSSGEFLSPGQITDSAINTIMGQFKARSKWADYGGENPNGFATATIEQFQRFTSVEAA